MFIREIMGKQLITIRPSSTVAQAIEIMRNNHIRHLPVTDDKAHLLGLISDRDLRDATPSVFNELDEDDKLDYETPISDIMTKEVITGTVDDFIEDAASLFYEFKISSLPILSDGKLVGIITESDLLKIFLQMAGTTEPGSRFEIELEQHHTDITPILKIFQDKKAPVSNALLCPSSAPNKKRLVLRSPIMHTDELLHELSEKGYNVLWPKMK